MNAQPSQNSGGSADGKPSGQPSSYNEPDQNFYQWRRLIPRQPADPSACFGQRLAKFFRLGLTLVEGDLGVLQETVKLLASEGGLLSIRELVERHIPLCHSDANRLELWRTSVRPLFAILAEPRVSRSTLLEVHTGAIHNAILGYNASRLQPLYCFILSISDHWGMPTVSSQAGRKSEFLELCTSTLARIVDCNTQTLVNDAIPPIVVRLKAALESLKTDGSDFWILQSEKNLEYIQKRLSIVQGVAQPHPVAAHSLSRATFVLRRDLPGELSTEGPRHDNDHADCTKIRILPTMSEIMSTRQDYRPFYDPSQLHLPGVQGLIDRHFRLLREDTVGQLKDAVSCEFDRLNNPQNQSKEKSGVRTHSYEISDIVNITCNRRFGLEIHMEIEQPFRPNPRSKVNCEEFWGVTRRLEPGALVCVLQQATAIFCVVSESTIRPDPNRPKTQKKEEGSQTSTKRDLYSDPKFSYVNLCLAEPQAADVEAMIRAFKSGLSSYRVLVEFPGILLPSFQSTLVALQQIYKTADLPFSEILAPAEDSPDHLTIPAPLYSKKPGFAFNLKSITKKGDDLLLTTDKLLRVLMRSGALSKSSKDHLGQVKAGRERQFSKCFLTTEAERILAQYSVRSKSTLLADVNLKKVAKEMQRTKAEKKEVYKHATKLTSIGKEITACLDKMKTAASVSSIKEYLAQCDDPTFHNAIFGIEAEEGWTRVTYKDDSETLNAWVHAGAVVADLPRPINVLKRQQPDGLSQLERQELCRAWTRELMEEHIEEFLSLEADHRQAKSELETVHREIDLRVLSECQIIGVTTTGLAKNLELLRKVDSKVLLCEEAGEVLESHILTALLPSLEHVILIGDHLQLRPQVANYELSVNNPLGEQYSLDVSLFERLVQPVHLSQPKLPFDTLSVQRRMHPSISRLIRETIYPNIEDAAHLSDYPEVVGMRKRLFWFDHNNPESGEDPTQPLGTSRTNDFEVEMVAATVSHLVRQGVYARDQIAVITPYLGQLHELRKRLRNSFEIVLGDRDTDELDKQGLDLDVGNTSDIQKKSLGNCLTLATVDNFQGEEAQVVVISLVRSNPEGRCGFLKTSNRINVLLSRAKHGMFIFGNSKTYAQVRMWSDVIGMLKADGNFVVLPPAIGLPVLCVARNSWLAAINAHRFAERFALNLNTAKSAPLRKFKLTSMDGQLGMSDHYDIADDGHINGIKESGDPTQLKSCPTCRGSLRNLARYGRLVREALLEDSTKKFITWSHNKSMDFEKRLLDEQERLDHSAPGKEMLATIGRQGSLLILGPRLQQLLAISGWVGHGRYDHVIKLYREIAGYVHHVAIEEQPYQRVYDLVQHARRRGAGTGQFLLNTSKLETRGLLLAGCLLLRCDLLILRDFVTLYRQADEKLTTIVIDLVTTLRDCNEVIRIAREKRYVRHEAEGHIYFVQFTALARMLYLGNQSLTSEESELMDRLKTQAEEHVNEARTLLDLYKGSTSHLVQEFETAELMLNDFVRYTPVSAEEKRAIWLAMSREFQGTGHWYRCQNGHPFTVGECGMPMEQTRCPECGAAVGGIDHLAAEGVQYDADMDAIGTAAGNLNLGDAW
ncbi:hypothetical protein NUW58_g6426 [Xylaria curta]|uniref:Uncharacterized protein n=1 Tax=Xylaria curta TaxID=42375 RepID=A0ACC1NVZ8_9PEZI|nr:hypothetical protein NUW58_g6426 [Xylaria curta]